MENIPYRPFLLTRKQGVGNPDGQAESETEMPMVETCSVSEKSSLTEERRTL